MMSVQNYQPKSLYTAQTAVHTSPPQFVDETFPNETTRTYRTHPPHRQKNMKSRHPAYLCEICKNMV